MEQTNNNSPQEFTIQFEFVSEFTVKAHNADSAAFQAWKIVLAEMKSSNPSDEKFLVIDSVAKHKHHYHGKVTKLREVTKEGIEETNTISAKWESAELTEKPDMSYHDQKALEVIRIFASQSLARSAEIQTVGNTQ